MGRLKEHWIEKLEDRNIDLSNILEIAFEELEELNYIIEVDESTDGLIYGYGIEFQEGSPQEILSKIERLEDGCRVHLQPGELESEYDYEEQFDAVCSNTDYIKNYRNEIANLKSLCLIEVTEESAQQILFRQIFISIIGSMETFLSDAFINLTLNNEIYFRNFVKTHPEFKKRKIELKDILDEADKLRETAKRIMLDTIYHKLPNVRRMYIDTFKIDFPDIERMYGFVLSRHDLVHRNGKTKKGGYLVVDIATINDLIECSNKLVEELFETIFEENYAF